MTMRFSFLTLALCLLTPTLTEAQSELFACYVPQSGIVYRVNGPNTSGENPDLKDSCTGSKHVLFSWSAAGQGGGGSGWELITATVTIPGGINFASLSCPSGKFAVNGGRIQRLGGQNDVPTIGGFGFGILPDGTGLFVSGGAGEVIDVWVICVSG